MSTSRAGRKKEESGKAESEAKKRSKASYWGKALAIFFVTVFFILASSYLAMAVLSQDRSLPRLKFYGMSVGGKTKYEIKSAIDLAQEKIDKLDLGLEITLGEDSIQKTYRELGIRINKSATGLVIFNLGKSKRSFPSLDYLSRSARGEIEIKPRAYWESNPDDVLGELAEQVKTESENPRIEVGDNGHEIIAEKPGRELNSEGLKKKIEDCFVSRCAKAISAETRIKQSSFALRDIEPFMDDIEQTLNLQITLRHDNKRVIPKMEEVAAMIDLEGIALSQQMTLSDEKIEEYLKSIAGRFGQKPRNRIISSVDESVIDEGREGVQLDIRKSLGIVKKALLGKEKVAYLETTATPPKEERVGPGYTLGKYEGRYIEVNLTKQMLYTIEGDRLIGSYRVSTGKWSMPTPQGEFSINHKDPRAFSKKYNLYMPYWMAFIGSAYGIHELPEWADGTKEGESHLGTPVSHGCIRLGRGAAEEVYNWVEIGTPVYIHK